MANIWRKDDNVKEQPKRNIMDLSFQNNLTTQFGRLVPVFCKEFIPGDSFSIKPTFSLKFQPMVFPIQTRMRAHLHFFKVRNRNLWKDWEDFIAKNKENLDPPYLDTAVTKPTTGSLLDYFGVPTTISGSYGNYKETGAFENNSGLAGHRLFVSDDMVDNFALSTVNTVHSQISMGSSYADSSFESSLSSLVGSTISIVDSFSDTDYDYQNPTHLGNVVEFNADYETLKNSDRIGVRFNALNSASYINDLLGILPSSYTYDESTSTRTSLDDAAISYRYKQLLLCALDSAGKILSVKSPISLADNGLLYYDSFKGVEFSKVVLISGLDYLNVYSPSYWSFYESPLLTTFNNSIQFESTTNVSVTPLASDNTINAVSLFTYKLETEVVDIDDSNSPYWRSGATTDLRERIKLSALPCRAYEQIYNSFYRNAENNPYILNGVPEYNKYMPTDEGGVDANLYDFHYRNWEDDFLTTALQQPQAGIAPLVGLTGTAGTATVTLADEDGNISEATASYDEEGNVTSVAFANNTSLTEALADAVQYGISINDLRNVNAFQRWLEAKARGGYKYRDVIESMFGISVRYDTLDMPEFIGGTSIDIMVNQISQTVPTETSPLGDYAGQAAGIGTGQTINEYFDEHGFVIGILSVVPVPNYSQLLPKHFIKRDAFDYYFPQFGHIGMQPIKYNEVCPVQSFQESTEQNNVLDETFGYQRAWYDYLASTDEVHGEFRTNLRNFVMNRTFDVKPELVKEFLTVDPSQLNDVFAISDDSYDKILGQIYFDVKAKRPIPLYGIPKLE